MAMMQSLIHSCMEEYVSFTIQYIPHIPKITAFGALRPRALIARSHQLAASFACTLARIYRPHLLPEYLARISCPYLLPASVARIKRMQAAALRNDCRSEAQLAVLLLCPHNVTRIQRMH